MGGQARFGPDVEWVDAIDYEVDPARGERFYDAVRRYWPDLPDGSLQPGYSGVRPKIAGPGEPAGDFVIQGPRDHGAGPVINLFGIESPGLTASLALADMVAQRASGRRLNEAPAAKAQDSETICELRRTGVSFGIDAAPHTCPLGVRVP